MGRYEYPRVNPPASQLQLQPFLPGQHATEADSRPYSWVHSAREPADGRFRTGTTESNVPPLPQIPAHLHPALEAQGAAPAEPESPAPAYPIDQKVDTREHNLQPISQQSDASAGAPDAQQRSFHRSTPSIMAPEVIKYEYHAPRRQEPVTVAPDVNPLFSTTPMHPPARTNTTNIPIIPPSEPTPTSLPSRLVQVSHGGTWRHALCSCADTPTCLTGLFCPCVLYGKTQHRLTLRAEKKDPTNMLGYSALNGSCAVFAVLCGCNFILAAIQRTRVRKAYGMGAEAGGVGDDCVKSLCCCCCTLAQDEKEVKWRETEARSAGGEGGKSQYQAPMGMSYPGPPR